jgi:transcriptional regulator of arginine metabolism
MKNIRHNIIIKIVKENAVRTHDELIDALKNEGVNVTQATVSRDIKELGLIKVPDSNGGSMYSLPQVTAENGITRLDMVSNSVRRISSALHTIVLNTYPSMASAVAASIDATMKNDILGSIAGDDTVLVITESAQKAKELEAGLKKVFKAE